MIGINGLGRIGRLLLRRMAALRPDLLSAVNDPADPQVLAHLLRFDSVHGPCPLPVSHHRVGSQNVLRIGEAGIPLHAAADPGSIPWEGVRIAVESSGRFTARGDAARHLKGPTSHVLISAPSPDPDATIIAPVNGETLDLSRHRVISNGSCTAHATAPMLQVLKERFGLGPSGMSTIHVATNDQRLLDRHHHDRRRARAAFLSIIPTRSSAFGALHQAMKLPSGFSGCAIRVPTLSVNLVDVVAMVDRPASVDGLNAAFHEASMGALSGILGLAHDHGVSQDFTGRPESVLMDLEWTQVLGDRFVKVVGWHDNETGYTARLQELAIRIAASLESKPDPRQT